jgi:hypothetical protein
VGVGHGTGEEGCVSPGLQAQPGTETRGEKAGKRELGAPQLAGGGIDGTGESSGKEPESGKFDPKHGYTRIHTQELGRGEGLDGASVEQAAGIVGEGDGGGGYDA